MSSTLGRGLLGRRVLSPDSDRLLDHLSVLAQIAMHRLEDESGHRAALSEKFLRAPVRITDVLRPVDGFGRHLVEKLAVGGGPYVAREMPVQRSLRRQVDEDLDSDVDRAHVIRQFQEQKLQEQESGTDSRGEPHDLIVPSTTHTVHVLEARTSARSLRYRQGCPRSQG